MDMVTYEVCGPNSAAGCECSFEEIDEGGRCDKYGEHAPHTVCLMQLHSISKE